MFIRKAATVVAGAIVAMSLAATPAAAAVPVGQPAIAQQASPAIVAPTMWISSPRYPTKQACNYGRFAAAKQGWKTSDCAPASGGGWSFGMAR